MLTPKEILNLIKDKKYRNDTFKWVRMKNGEFRFGPSYESHSSLIENDEKATSAGTFSFILGKYILVMGMGSQTCDCPGNEKDIDELKKIFGMRIRQY